MPTTSNFGWTTPADTDLVKDGAAAIRTLGNGIDTSLVDLKGGTTGQVLSKASNTDLDFVWSADAAGIPPTIFDAKGDLIAASAADTAARLAVGTNNQVLMADSTTATGLKYANEATATLTAKGDILTATAANTISRLGVGSNNQVLTADSATATGLKWATPTVAAQSFTQLSSASVGTGTSYTVTGLSGYNQLFFQFTNISENGAGEVTFRFNSDQGANQYDYNGLGFFISSGSTILQEIQSSLNRIIVALPNSASFDCSGGLLLMGANSTGIKVFQSIGSCGANNNTSSYSINGVYKGTSVISSVTIGADGNNFDAGTLTIWGAA